MSNPTGINVIVDERGFALYAFGHLVIEILNVETDTPRVV